MFYLLTQSLCSKPHNTNKIHGYPNYLQALEHSQVAKQPGKQTNRIHMINNSNMLGSIKKKKSMLPVA